MLDRLGLGDLLDLPPLAQRELRRMAACVLRAQRIEPVSVEVWNTSRARSWLVNATFAIAAASMPWADSSTICARRQVTTDPLPRGDPHQPPTLVIINLTHPQPLSHPASLKDQRLRGKAPGGANLICYGTRFAPGCHAPRPDEQFSKHADLALVAGSIA